MGALLLLAAGASACADIIGADEWTPKGDVSSGSAGAGPGSTAGGGGMGAGQSSASSSTSGGGGGGGAGGDPSGSGGASTSSSSAGGGGSVGGAGGSSSSSTGAGGAGGAGGVAPTCMDGIQNGTEADVDCGGGNCIGCGLCKKCVAFNDCMTGCCNTGVCAMFNFNSATCDPSYTCPDGCLNGNETDVDCGGSGTCPTTCPTGAVCTQHGDCTSAYCHPVNKVCS